ncbi:hypothetical protein DBR40_13210 [Pedobacter sp. KBW01]|uniref:glycosyltransferase n=1 Tax=Pedobacter sp. KBW01 TaxID=2153364 RepID=UPI000F597DD6|nr:glycosyltransferase [Pedobacter sp. KBW01]RQO73762.1 hypothetical protein DBR40_13210 [Pedobacter sp. KBW01]
MPETTILIPTYNCAKFINQAVKSVLLQDYRDYEVLILDDGSTDNTEEVVSRIHDARITYIRSESNKGIVSALNEGIIRSNGNYIARMDADDILLGDRLSSQIDFLNANNDHGLVGGWYQTTDIHGRILDRIETPCDPWETKMGLLFQNKFAHSAVTMRAEYAFDLRYDQEYQYAEDYDLWCRIASISKVSNLPSYFLSYRWYQGNSCSLNQKILKMNTLKVLSRELDKYGIVHSSAELVIHGALCFRLGKQYFNTKELVGELENWFEKILGSHLLSNSERSALKGYIVRNYNDLIQSKNNLPSKQAS